MTRTFNSKPVLRSASWFGRNDCEHSQAENSIFVSYPGIAPRLRQLLARLLDLQSSSTPRSARAPSMQGELDRLQRENDALLLRLEGLARSEAEARHIAFHDELTGLLNRKGLRERFDWAAKETLDPARRFAVAFIDIDSFKRINDDFGHGFGDEVLASLGSRLRRSLRPTDSACRYGGDEFVVMLPDIAVEATATSVAMNLGSRLPVHYQVGETEIELHVSVGAALYPDDGCTLDDLVHYADVAMYDSRARRQRLPRVCSVQIM